MLSVAEAQALVLKHTPRLPVEVMRAGAPALGYVLADEVVSDADSPPFDKAMVDGFAVRSADVSGRAVTLRIVGEVLAGQTTSRVLGPGETICIMTGAPTPAGADAVIMHEKTTLSADSGSVTIPGPITPRQNIVPRGAEMRCGDRVLAAGTVLGPPELGTLATLGKTQLKVHRRPTVAVLSTGDELVEPGEELKAGQIRNSNAVMLQALAVRAGGLATYLGIARDHLESLRSLLEHGLRHDVLLITGGVSAGKVDLVPQALAELGVEAILHKVALKPGKPIFFGRRSATLVFGLPGNPVSSYVGFELFVRPALKSLQGRQEAACRPRMLRAELAHDFDYKSDRPSYHPACLEGCRVTLPRWHGSADLRALSGTDGFAVVPAGEMRYPAGTPLDVIVPDLD